MSMLSEVVRELFGMFVADLRLAIGVIALVGLVALLVDALAVPPLAGGALMLAGSLLILAEAVVRMARDR